MAGLGGSEDGGSLQVHGGQAGGVADGIGDGSGVVHGGLGEALPVIGGVLSGGDDVHHGLQGLHGVLAGGGLTGEHHAAGAIEHGVGHVRHLSTGGTGIADHGVQHLGGGDHVLALGDSSLDHALLDDGHVLSGDLHAQVATGHHQAIGNLEDLLQIVHALLVFDLGDDADVLAAVGVQNGTDLLHVGGLTHKGGGNEVEVVLHGELQIALVLLGQSGQGDVGVGDVDGLVVGQGAASDHVADDVLTLDFGDLDVHQAVVNEQVGAHGHLVVQVGVGHGHDGVVAVHLAGGQGEGIAIGQLDLAVGKRTNANLRALGVQNGGHGAAQTIPDVLHTGENSQVGLVGAVREVEAGGVHAGEDELLNHLLAVGSRAQGTNNLCLSHRNVSSVLSFTG